MGHFVVLSNTRLWRKEANMVVSSMMTCKTGLIWRRMKTLYWQQHHIQTKLQLPSTREFFGFNAPGHCLVHTCLMHCMCAQLRNGYTHADSQLINIRTCTRQWPDALKPKSYSLIKGNQTIEGEEVIWSSFHALTPTEWWASFSCLAGYVKCPRFSCRLLFSWFPLTRLATCITSPPLLFLFPLLLFFLCLLWFFSFFILLLEWIKPSFASSRWCICNDKTQNGSVLFQKISREMAGENKQTLPSCHHAWTYITSSLMCEIQDGG